jgi:hypothetical protein
MARKIFFNLLALISIVLSSFAFVVGNVSAAPTQQQQAQAAQLSVGVHQTYLTGSDWVKVWLVAYNQTNTSLNGRVEVEVNGKSDSKDVNIGPIGTEDVEFKWQDNTLPDDVVVAKFRICTEGFPCPSWQERVMTDRRDGKVGNEIKIDTDQDGCKAGMKPGSDPKVWWMTTDGQEVAYKVVAPNEWFWADFSKYAVSPGVKVVAVLIVEWPDMAPVSQRLTLDDCIGKEVPTSTPTDVATATPEGPNTSPTATPIITETTATPVGQPTPVATPSASPTPTQPPVDQPPPDDHYSITTSGEPTLECESGVCLGNVKVVFLKNGNDIGVNNKKEYKSWILPVPKGYWKHGRDDGRNWNELVSLYQTNGVDIEKPCFTFNDFQTMVNGHELEGFIVKAIRNGQEFYKYIPWEMTIVDPQTCRVPANGPIQSGCVLLPNGDYDTRPYGTDGQPVEGIRVEDYNCEETVPVVECKWTKESVQAIRDRNPGHTVVWNEATGVVTFDGDTVETCGLPNTSGEFDPNEQPWRLPVPIGGSLRVEFMLEYGV